MYDLEIKKLVEEIKSSGAKKVLLQLPDGLKHFSNKIVEDVERETEAEAYIWFGSCFGACDIPLGLEILGIDIIVQWGHNKFLKEEW